MVQGLRLLIHVLGTFNLCGGEVIKNLTIFSHFWLFLLLIRYYFQIASGSAVNFLFLKQTNGRVTSCGI